MSGSVVNLADFRKAASRSALSPDYIKFTPLEMRSLLAIYTTGIGNMTYSDYLIDVGASPTAYFYAFKRDNLGNIVDEIAITKQRSPSKQIPYFAVRVNGAVTHQGYAFKEVKQVFRDNDFSPTKPAGIPFKPPGS